MFPSECRSINTEHRLIYFQDRINFPKTKEHLRLRGECNCRRNSYVRKPNEIRETVSSRILITSQLAGTRLKIRGNSDGCAELRLLVYRRNEAAAEAGRVRGRLHKCGINYFCSGGNVVFAIYSTFCCFRAQPCTYEGRKGRKCRQFPTHGRDLRELHRFLTL